eukprot:193211-Pleurochrysis_carterae.AAC.1
MRVRLCRRRGGARARAVARAGRRDKHGADAVRGRCARARACVCAVCKDAGSAHARRETTSALSQRWPPLPNLRLPSPRFWTPRKRLLLARLPPPVPLSPSLFTCCPTRSCNRGASPCPLHPSRPLRPAPARSPSTSRARPAPSSPFTCAASSHPRAPSGQGSHSQGARAAPWRSPRGGSRAPTCRCTVTPAGASSRSKTGSSHPGGQCRAPSPPAAAQTSGAGSALRLQPSEPQRA